MHQPIVVLASSRKLGGICLAGKRADGEGSDWVRPVSARPGQEWPHSSLDYLAGGVPQVGDRIALPLGALAPAGHQRENCKVRFEPWHAAGRLAAADILRLADDPATLWCNGWHSVHGWNDRIPLVETALHCRNSLVLVRPESLRFRLGQQGGNLTLRAVFVYRGERYDLRITDEPACSRWIERLAYGHDGYTDALLCVSLALPFQGYCYKIVAGVIELRAGG